MSILFEFHFVFLSRRAVEISLRNMYSTQCKSALACLWVCLYLFVFQAGDAGVPGQQGSRGKRGPAGESGRKGRVGSKGVIGDGGPVGFQGPPGPPVSLKIQFITFVFLLYAMVGNSIKRKRLTT